MAAAPIWRSATQATANVSCRVQARVSALACSIHASTLTGALRDALPDAGAKPETAKEAAEEVAGYENRLTRLTTMVQVMLAIGLLLLGSQAAIWMEIGKLNGSLTQLNSRPIS